MSDTGRQGICPRCGEPMDPGEGNTDPTGGGTEICEACYFDSFEMVDAPDRLEVPVCARCGAVKRGEQWVDVGARDYADVAVEAVGEEIAIHVDAEDVTWEARPESVDETTVNVHARFTGNVQGHYIDREVTVPVKMGRQTCSRCGRIAGDYYAATVQVRAADRDPTPEEIEGAREIAQGYVADREDSGDREAFITEMGETDAGLDVRVSTSQIGRAIANRVAEQYGGTVDDSRRLITEDGDGRRVYRMAYAVRLPPYREGEVIDPEDGDGPVLVESPRGTLSGRRLATGDTYRADHVEGDAPEARRLGTAAEGQETTLVAVEDDHAVQVLDPETYETESIPRPDYLDPDADTVTVLKSREGLYVLPGDDGE